MFLLISTNLLTGAHRPQSITQSLSFTEFTDAYGELRQACDAYPTIPERLEQLLTFFTPHSGTYTIKITDIPPYNTSIIISIDGSKSNLRAYNEGCVYLLAWIKNKEIHLARLDAEKGVITGKSLMQIFESFCFCCACEKATITDGSRYDGFELRKLLPFINQTTWYGSFGYTPEDVDEHRAAQRAVQKINKRPIKILLDDFSKNSIVHNALHDALDLTNMTSSTHTFGELIKALYVRYRASNSSTTATKLLKILYKNCIEAYTATCNDAFRIECLQRSIFDAWHKVEKRYTL